MPCELGAQGVLVEGGGFFSEGVVDVVGGLVAKGVGDQARGAEVVEVEVTSALLRFRRQEEAASVNREQRFVECMMTRNGFYLEGGTGGTFASHLIFAGILLDNSERDLTIKLFADHPIRKALY